MELHEEIRRARLALELSQDQLAELCGVQRRQISILENGGNVTLNTLRKVIGFLPNLQEFTFQQVRMKPQYFDVPPFDWTKVRGMMIIFMETLDELTKAVNRHVTTGDAEVDTDPEGVMERTERVMGEWVEVMGQALKEGWKEQVEKQRAERHARPKKKKKRKA